MQRIFLSVTIMSALLSCSKYEVSRGPEIIGWGGMGGSYGGSSVSHSPCYMTAFDYQKNYNWRTDEARESVKCSLVVFADGVPVMKVPVGKDYETGSDPDMHRVVKDHLYTDYSTETETVIKRDGIQIFRYPDREMICGLEIINEDLYTLGQLREGGGLVFRKNGEVIFKRDGACIIGKLVNDRDRLCFAYCEQIHDYEKPIYRYHVMVNGVASQVAVREDLKSVWDIHVSYDEVVYVASLTGLDLPVLCVGETMKTLPMMKGATLISCKIFRTADNIGVEGICQIRPGVRYNVIWLDETVLFTAIRSDTVSALDTEGNGVFCAINSLYKGKGGVIYRSGEFHTMPTGYAVMGPDTIKSIDGILYVGLSSLDGGKPIVWKDGVVDTLNINGYISAIYSEPEY